MSAERKPVDVMAAISCAVAGLHEAGENKYASDLLDAKAVLAEALRCANGLQNALDLRHPARVVNNWRKSLNDALYASGFTSRADEKGAASHG